MNNTNITPTRSNTNEIGKIVKKLENLNETEDFSLNWSEKEKLQILKIYKIFCDKEKELYDLVWENHGCDSWEDIFRDYDEDLLREKAWGVEVAIKYFSEKSCDENELTENELTENLFSSQDFSG